HDPATPTSAATNSPPGFLPDKANLASPPTSTPINASQARSDIFASRRTPVPVASAKLSLPWTKQTMPAFYFIVPRAVKDASLRGETELVSRRKRQYDKPRVRACVHACCYSNRDLSGDFTVATDSWCTVTF